MNQVPQNLKEVEKTIQLVLQKLIAKDIEVKVMTNSTINWTDYVFEDD